ncbi:hypothetical protein MNQ95_14325 [Pseudoxanthomonas daejeonensis]|uniref:Flagellar protein FliT n=1 Tax=Pseudoxanthomonas daejeonensis TaxID=266062 RepID=A0ABQ6Z6H5_9GAMM|nr:hypothetical protein [Pseudoxanthomonas daejeonensis]KAF1694050.1 hypothetical protein CSC65_10340 [Pseudoxanthomonas daejeonensis]UNK57291.1 hypothetical protein MNQ95_14325 [Pseudoxanthomonas daejeonensis]
MTGTAARLDALRGAMASIRATLERDDLAALPSMIDDYDVGVREFCALPDARLFAGEIGALRDLQLDTIERMRERKGLLLDLIRQQRQSTQAASAYARAGTR